MEQVVAPKLPLLELDVSARQGRLDLSVAMTIRGASAATVLVGPNGAGKSTLLAVMLGTVPAKGRIRVADDVLLDSQAGVCVPVERRRLAYLPQDYALFPHLDVRGNITFALASARGTGDAAALRARVERNMEEMQIAHLAARKHHQLSGGERQRVALARALAMEPRALLLDEPLAALDVHARKDVRRHLRSLLARLALPAIIVSHDPEDARTLGHEIVVLENGRVTQCGTWDEITARPATTFVESFTGV